MTDDDLHKFMLCCWQAASRTGPGKLGAGGDDFKVWTSPYFTKHVDSPIQLAFCNTVRPHLRQDDKHELSDSHSFPHAQGHFYGEDSWHGVMVTERKTHFLQWLKWLIYIAAFKDHCNVDHVAFQGCNKADPSRKPAMEGGFFMPRLMPGTPISSHPRAAVQQRTSAGCC